MKLLIVTLIGLVANVFALPQYGSNLGGNGGGSLIGGSSRPKPNLPAGCRIEYKTVYDIEEVENFETKYRKECNEVCNPWTENKCETLYRKKCETKWRDNCYDIDVPYEEDVCVDKDIAVCKKHWQCSNPSLPLSECNDKVWVDNKNECEYLKKSFCDKVQKYRKEQKCDKESWQDCKNQPYEKCNKITHNNCKNVCKDVPYQVHSKEPKQITRRRPFRVCNGSNKPDYRYTDQEIEKFDFGLRSGAVDSGLIEDKKEVEETTKTPKKSSSAITFG